jgi:outer membrane protein OmpA-like peptidoglycan-associated protein
MFHGLRCRWGLALIAAIALRVFSSVNDDGQNGVVRTISAIPFGKAKMNIGFGANFAQSSDYVEGPTFGPYSIARVVEVANPLDSFFRESAKMFSSNIYMGLGLADFWDVSMALPFYYDWAGFQDLKDGGLGDLELTSKWLLPPMARNKFFYESIIISMTAPTGMRGNGLFPRTPHLIAVDGGWNPANNFYSTDYITIKPLLAFTFDVGAIAPKVPLKLHINAGGVFTEAKKQNTVAGALALEYTPRDFLTLFVDVSAESRWKNLAAGYDVRKDPIWATPGLKITTPTGMYISLAGDFSLSSDRVADRMNWDKKGYLYSTGVIPKYGVEFSLGWTGFMAKLDNDNDGIPNAIDKCPDDPEDIDGFEDSDGCPDPDNDKDGICDPWVATKGLSGKYASVCKGIDKCPDVPEDFDGFQDDDGCPDPDNDNDHIPDILDQCPNAPEDYDGFEDNDGCPDYDNDKDGVPDSLDKCPNIPEDIDGFKDDDGCPDLDNDQDGIPDLKDKCPNEPETINGYMDEDGCPDTAPPPAPMKKTPDFPQQQILQGLEFKKGKAEIIFSSYMVLDRMAKTLKEFPELEIEVRGYTDRLGKGESNMLLTQMRAEAVRQYLINQGIDPQRIRAMGLGSNNPIGDNRTAEGRAANRRIEVMRTK